MIRDPQYGSGPVEMDQGPQDESELRRTNQSTRERSGPLLDEQGRSQEGRRGCAPLGFSDPAGRRPARAKNSSQTITEVTKSARKPTQRHVRAVGAPLTIWARHKKAPATIRGPSDSQSNH